jgi:hypothetical protein
MNSNESPRPAGASTESRDRGGVVELQQHLNEATIVYQDGIGALTELKAQPDPATRLDEVKCSVTLRELQSLKVKVRKLVPSAGTHVVPTEQATQVTDSTATNIRTEVQRALEAAVLEENKRMLILQQVISERDGFFGTRAQTIVYTEADLIPLTEEDSISDYTVLISKILEALGTDPQVSPETKSKVCEDYRLSQATCQLMIDNRSLYSSDATARITNARSRVQAESDLARERERQGGGAAVVEDEPLDPEAIEEASEDIEGKIQGYREQARETLTTKRKGVVATLGQTISSQVALSATGVKVEIFSDYGNRSIEDSADSQLVVVLQNAIDEAQEDKKEALAMSGLVNVSAIVRKYQVGTEYPAVLGNAIKLIAEKTHSTPLHSHLDHNRRQAIEEMRVAIAIHRNAVVDDITSEEAIRVLNDPNEIIVLSNTIATIGQNIVGERSVRHPLRRGRSLADEQIAQLQLVKLHVEKCGAWAGELHSAIQGYDLRLAALEIGTDSGQVSSSEEAQVRHEENAETDRGASYADGPPEIVSKNSADLINPQEAYFGDQPDEPSPEPPPITPEEESPIEVTSIIPELSHPGFERLEPPHSYAGKAHEGTPIDEWKEEGIRVGEQNVSWGIYQVDSKQAPHMWVLDVGAGGQAADFSLNMDGNRNECEHGDFAVIAVAQPNGVEPDRRWTIQAELLRRTPALTESVQHPPETLFIPTEMSIGESATIVITNWPRNDGAVHTNHHESHMIHIQGTEINIILDNFDMNCLVNVEGARGQPIAILKEDGSLITGGENPHPTGLYIITKEQGAIRVRIDDITCHSHQEQPTTSFTLNIAQSQDTDEQLQPAGGLVRVIHEGDLESPVIQQYDDNAVSGLNERLDLIKDEPIGGRDGVLMTLWPSAGNNRKEIAISGENKIEFGFDDYKAFEGSHPKSILPRLWVYQEGAMVEALSMQMEVDNVISGDFGNYKIIAVAAPSDENQYNLTAAVYSLSTAEAASRLVAIQTLESRAHDAELNEQTGSALQLYTEAIDLYAELERKGMLDRKGTHRIVELYERIGVLGDKLGATPLTEHKRVLLTPEPHVVTGPPFEPQEYSIQHEGGEIRFGVDNIKEGFDGINPDNLLPRVWVYQQGVTQQAISFQPTQSGDQYPRRLFGDCSIIALPEHLEDDTWKVTIAIFQQPTKEGNAAVEHEEKNVSFQQRLDEFITHVPGPLQQPTRRLYEIAWDGLHAELDVVKKVGEVAGDSHIPFLGPAFAGFAEFIQGTFTLRNLETGFITPESRTEAHRHFVNWITSSIEGGIDLAEFVTIGGSEIEAIRALQMGNDNRNVLLPRIITLIACRGLERTSPESNPGIISAIGRIARELLQDKDIVEGITTDLLADQRFTGFLDRLKDHLQRSPPLTSPT